MIIKEVRFPLLSHPKTSTKLYPHQAALWDAWDSESALLLASKTGTGKTRAAMIPIMEEGHCGLAIYPTNELLGDQVMAVSSLAKSEEKNAVVWTPETASPELHSQADWLLIPIDGKLLTAWQKQLSCKSRGETLRRLLDPDQKKIVFTNPDILFLILGLYYHAEPFEALRAYKTLVIDEFHLYHGVELAHALAMVAIARGFGIFRKTVLLSATPQEGVLDLLRASLDVKVIGSDPISTWEPSENEFRTAVHRVELQAVMQQPSENIEAIRDELDRIKADLIELREKYSENSYIPGVTIVNSVFAAIRLEDQLVAAGFDRQSLSIVRGLSNRAIRDRRGKLVALGTSAIEVGVDFDCDHLLFEAIDASSFLQRFGRVGRHRAGRAKAWVPPNAIEGMQANDLVIERGDFEKLIYSWYPQLNSSPWFVLTEHGMITARAIAENLYKTVEGNSEPHLLKRLRSRLDEILFHHAEKLGCRAQEVQSQKLFERAEAGKKSAQWLGAYCGLNRFRTSLPALEIHDFAEQGRRSEWNLGDYETDLLTLLKRGRTLQWNEKLSKLTIAGIGAVQKVHASEIFSDDDCYQILETKEFPLLAVFQDGKLTPISDIFGRRNHVFCVVPRTTIAGAADWRLPLIESGRYVLAFDGAALMLLELSRKCLAGQ
ncbi:MAG: type I-D CRISPR-associated helicase Cas3' [Candidatus Obscuribacterales bacterium]|nr:type I-D CRISPR-associated helicase Cas3' [Candidatus Obscuribacterales bacterium]